MPKPLDLDAFLAGAPVFSLEELARARGEHGQLAAARNQLKRHLASERVQAVARQIYAAVPPGLDARRFRPDPFLVAAAARPDGVFAYHSALELLGAAHSVWHECTLHCDRRRAPLEVGATRILFLATPTALKRHGFEHLAIRSVAHLSRQLWVTGPERTLVEGLRHPHHAGGLEELVESVQGFPLLDFPLFERVLAVYGENTLWAAVGWLAELHRDAWATPAAFLDRCRERRPLQNQYILRGLRGGRLLRDWRLIVPEQLAREAKNHVAYG